MDVGAFACFAHDRDEAAQFNIQLRDKGYLSCTVGEFSPSSVSRIAITLVGLNYLEEREAEIALGNEVFLAMWFDDSMDTFHQHLKQAFDGQEELELVRIDKTEHNNKIDDEIISRIRNCRLVVADFTCEEAGKLHRGGVYYEAGFARGLGKEVVFTVRKDCLENLHFDTRQYNHIVWEEKGGDFVVDGNPNKTLAEAILERIAAVGA